MKGHTAENSLKALKKEADERLLIEAAQQDPARFAELYEINFERVYAYVVRRVGNRTETEDLTSEVFHQALANLKRFEWRGIPFAAWLFRIAANLISDRWQRSGREVADESDRSNAAAGKSGRRLKKWSGGPLCSAWWIRLPAEQRRVVVLRFVEAEKHQGSGAGDSQDRGRGEAAAVPRAQQFAGAHGGCRCLSAL